jgi:hypothetical protein
MGTPAASSFCKYTITCAHAWLPLLLLLLLLCCCSGNDFSTLYAPLIRDGRMEKYYWNPTREDRIGVCMGIFQVCGG